MDSFNDNVFTVTMDVNIEAAIHNPLSNCRPIMETMMEQLDASEITITFKESFMETLGDIDMVISLIGRYFASLPFNDIREIILVPEYGETNRLHFHGVIRASAKTKASLLLFLKKRFGRSEIKTIRNTISYLNYMLKENPTQYIYKKY